MAPPDEGTSLSASSGNDPVELEVYGPIGFRRYVKGDGRGLILYTHGGPAQDTAAQEGPART
jgi:hypothetical protein